MIRALLAIGADKPYHDVVLAKSRAGFGDPRESRRTSAHTTEGAFFVPAFNGGCAWEAFGPAGFLDSRFANPRAAISLHRLATVGDGSSNLGVRTMQSLSRAVCARIHRRLGLAALYSDSSLSVRLRRYNRHMTKARSLEAREGSV